MPIVHIPLDGALRAYAVHRWGEPLNFPRGTYEDLLLIQHTIPAAAPSAPRSPYQVPVVAPSLPKPHPGPPVPVALTPQGRYLLCDSIERHLRLDLWHEIFPHLIRADAAALSEAIDRWCRNRNIPLQHRQTIVQRFYRLRRRYITTRTPFTSDRPITYGLLTPRGRKKKHN